MSEQLPTESSVGSGGQVSAFAAARFLDTPWLAREMRSRWRRLISFGTLLGVNLALLGVLYSSLPHYTELAMSEVLGSRITFCHFWTVVWVWLLILPVLVAPALPAERNQGSLEMLLLTRLTPVQIMGGLALKEVLFAFTLYLSTLPVLGIALVLGGVDPAQIIAFGFLHAGMVILVVCCSLVASIRSPSSSSAIFSTYGMLAVITVGTLFSSAAGYSALNSVVQTLTPLAPSWVLTLLGVLCGFLINNPGIAFDLMARNANPAFVACAFGCGTTMALGGLLGLWWASGTLHRPDAVFLSDSPGQMVTTESEKTEGPTPAPLWEIPLPLASRVRNPIIRLEVIKTVRFRAPSLWILLLTLPPGVLIYLAVYLPLHFIPSALQANFAAIGKINFVFGHMFTASLLILATNSWNKERQTGHGVHLRLLGMSPWQVVLTKMLGILTVACAGLILIMPSILSLAAGMWVGRLSLQDAVASTFAYWGAPAAVAIGSALGLASKRTGPATVGGLVILATMWALYFPYLDLHNPGRFLMRAGAIICGCNGVALVFVMWAVHQFSRLEGD